MMKKQVEKKKLSLPVLMLLGMVLGVLTGILLGDKAKYIAFIGTIFLRLLKMGVYPLILVSLIGGVANVMDLAKLKKIGLAFVIYSLASSAIASVFAYFTQTITKSGEGVNLGDFSVNTENAVDLGQTFIEWIPENVFASFANGSLVQIVIFAIFFGVLLAGTRNTKAGEAVYEIVIGLNDILLKMVGAVMKIAPIGVFSLVASMVGTTKISTMSGFVKMIGAYYLALLMCLLIFVPLCLILLAKVNPIKFYKNAFPVMVMAASTCSSMATLPITMETTEKRLGVDKDMVGMLMAPAATVNMNGACIEFTSYIIFAAAAYNMDLSIGQIITTIAICVIMSAGSSGVPGGGIVTASICLTTMGLPDSAIIAFVSGIYILIDFVGTMVNVTGDMVGAVTIASRTNMLDRETFNKAK